jgi:hypothetical protein
MAQNEFQRRMQLARERASGIPSDVNIQGNQANQNFEEQILDWLPDFIKQGYNNSVTGMARELAIGKKPFDIEEYEPGVLGDIGSGMVSLFMPADLITMAAGGGVGGFAVRSAAKRAGTMATKQLLRSGVSKNTTRAIVDGGVQRVVGGATGFAGYSGLASALNQQIQNSEIDYKEVLSESSKGALLGAATGGIGARAKFKGSSEAVRVLQEGTAFGALSPALEGRAPTPQDFIHSIGTVIGMRGVNTSLYLANQKRKQLISEKRRKELKPLAERLATEQVQKEMAIKSTADLYKSVSNPKDVVKIVSASRDKSGGTVFNLKNVETGEKSSLRKDIFQKKYTTTEGKTELIEKYKLYEAENQYSDYDIQIKRKLATGSKSNRRVRLEDMTNTQLANYAKQITADYRIREYKKKYLDLADLPQKTLLEHALPPSMVQFVLQAQNRAKALESRVLIDLIKTSDTQTKLTFERYQGKINQLLGSLSEKDLLKVTSYLEGSKEPITSSLRVTAKQSRQVFDEMYNYAKQRGIKVADYRSDYFPQMIKRGILDTISNDFMSMVKKRGQLLESGLSAESVRELNKFIERYSKTELSKETRNVVQHLVKKEGMTHYEAYRQLQNEVFLQQLRPFGNLEKARKINLPDEILEKDPLKVMTAYNMKLARRVEIASKFGLRGERAEKLINDIMQKNPSEARAMSAVWEIYSSQIESNPYKNFSPSGKKLAENVMAFEMGTKIALGTATIPNLSQFAISTAVEAGYFRTMKGAFRLLNPEVRKQLDATGSTYHNALDVLLGTNLNLRSADGIKRSIRESVRNPKEALLNISNGLATLSGFKGINYFNNLLAASTAQIFIKDLHRIANTSNIKSRKNWAITNLKRFGIDHTKKLSNEKMASGMFEFARNSQLQKDILRDPIAFNLPKWRPWIIFKRFGYRQANYIGETLKREAKAGNVAAILRLATGGVAGGYLVEKARRLYLKALTGEETFIEDKEGLDDIVDNLSAVGAFGVFGDLLGSEEMLSTSKFILTPVVVSDLERIGRGLASLAKNVDTFGAGEVAMRRSLTEFAPLFGSVPSRAIRKYQTPAQRLDKLDQRKSRLTSKLLDMMIAGKYDLVNSNVNQWNEKFPQSPITPADVNMRKALRKVLRKNKMIDREESLLRMEKAND